MKHSSKKIETSTICIQCNTIRNHGQPFQNLLVFQQIIKLTARDQRKKSNLLYYDPQQRVYMFWQKFCKQCCWTSYHISTTWSLIYVQPCHNTRSSSMVTLARPPTRSCLKITNRSFQYAAPYLWNQLPTELREPRQILSPSRSPPITHGCSSSLSPLSSCLTRSFFQSELKTWLFGKSFPP